MESGRSGRKKKKKKKKGTTRRDFVAATSSAILTGCVGVGDPTLSSVSGSTPSRLSFLVGPADAVAGIAVPIRVAILDQNGQPATAATNEVTLAIGDNPAAGALSGTVAVNAVDGVATFDGLSIDKAGTGYTLAASSDNLAGATSDPFQVTPGAGAQLVFMQQPSAAAAGAVIDPVVTVAVEDDYGNLVTSHSTPVRMAIRTNPTGGMLAGGTTVTPVAGIATFAGLSIDTPGSGYTLVASSGTLSVATSDPFDISAGAAMRLAFTQQPSTAGAGTVISPAVTVGVQDASGNTVTSYSAPVAVALGTNPAGGTLSGVVAVAPIDGVATFTDLSLDLAGSGYTLVASSGALAAATSDPFDVVDVTPGTATQLAFTQQPSAATAGAVISPAVAVAARDANGDLVASYDTPVGIAIRDNPSGGTLSGGGSVVPVGGVATFAGLSIDRPGSGYTLVASSGTLTVATSVPFNIAPAPATRLAFRQPPGETAAGGVISPPVTVGVEDANGNLVTSYSTPVAIAVGANPAGGTLSGVVAVTPIDGIATFADLSIDRPGSGYTLVASSGTLDEAISSPFDIAPAASRLSFTQQPEATRAGALIVPPVTASVLDANGDVVTPYATPVGLAIGNNPAGGALTGGDATLPSNGVASFDGLSIDQAGSGYTLVASSGTLIDATSDPFDVTSQPVGTGEYYISPNGSDSDNGLSSSTPWRTFSHAFGQMSSGDRLWLMDGSYGSATTGTISDSVPNGSSTSNMTILESVNGAGNVTHDARMNLSSSRYVKIKGVYFPSGADIGGTNYIYLKNSGFYSSTDTASGGALDMGGADYALVEDCWAWGRRRTQVMNDLSNNNVLRRVVIRRESSNATVNIGYHCYMCKYMMWQNCIAIDGVGTSAAYADFGQATRSSGNGHGGNRYMGCMSINSDTLAWRLDDNDASHITVNDPMAKLEHCATIGSSGTGIFVPGAGDAQIEIEKCSVHKSGGNAIDLSSLASGGYSRDLVAYGSGSRGIRSSYSINNSDSYGYSTPFGSGGTGQITSNPENDGTPASIVYPVRIESGSLLDGLGIGADIRYRYGVDGTHYGETGWDTLTAVELWPFPNEALIRAQMRVTSSAVADPTRGFCADGETLTHYIWNMLGNGSPY
jgi:hypothetical protein